MRRSIGVLALSLTLVTLAGSASPRPPYAATTAVSGSGEAVLLVGIGWTDPGAMVEAGIWAALELVRLAGQLEDAFNELKDGVKRAVEHPQSRPRIRPVVPRISPERSPVPIGRKPHRIDAPAPIPDSLPARSIS
jgi:hypothetical protein